MCFIDVPGYVRLPDGRTADAKIKVRSVKDPDTIEINGIQVSLFILKQTIETIERSQND